MSSSPYFAAVDLGSNSFHMLIGRVNEGKLEVIDREKEMVQIARGLDTDGNLDNDAKTRALECLHRFSERLRDIPEDQVRAVGTKTLRSTKQSGDFLRIAAKTLGHPIQIISGFEEARLVYSGLSHSIMNDNQHRLVVDIGGGSTEFIIGKDYEPILLESLGFGCVAYTNEFFNKDLPISEAMRLAHLSACSEIEDIRKPYTKKGWNIAYGTSGTIKAVSELVSKDGASVITAEQLNMLMEQIIETDGVIDKSVAKLRRDVLPAGVAILKAIFDQLKIDELHAAPASLKDGLIFDTIGRFSDEDIRENTVGSLINRHNIDTEHAARTEAIALHFWKSIKKQSPTLSGVSRTKVLSWAAKLHEIGLSISHTSHHSHGHYLLQHSDLAGFGGYEQYILANLVRFHRKKIKNDVYSGLNQQVQQSMIAMLVCLRLAVRFCRRREDIIYKEIKLELENDSYNLIISSEWLDRNPLTKAGLHREIDLLGNLGISLTIQD